MGRMPIVVTGQVTEHVLERQGSRMNLARVLNRSDRDRLAVVAGDHITTGWAGVVVRQVKAS